MTVLNRLVILPTYNESENIETMISSVFSHLPDVHVLVVDDSSPDGTSQIVEKVKEGLPDQSALHLIVRESKDGLGKAYETGFRWAIKSHYDQIITMDADGSHDPAFLLSLVEAAEVHSAGLVLGSRWVPGGAVQGWPWYRQMLSRGGTKYAQIALRTRIRDITGGYRLYTCPTLERLLEHPVEAHGYAFQIELAWRAERLGCSVVETPIIFIERVSGKSKMSMSIVVEAMRKVGTWGIQDRLSKRKPLV